MFKSMTPLFSLLMSTVMVLPKSEARKMTKIVTPIMR